MFVEKRFFATSVANLLQANYVESFPDFKVLYRNKRATSDHNKENSRNSLNYGYLRRERERNEPLLFRCITGICQILSSGSVAIM